jgi:hypothetical protein
LFSQSDNGATAAAAEKPISPAENSKDLSTPDPPADPGECRNADAQIDEPAVAADDKTDATPPIADGAILSSLTFQSYFPFTFINNFIFKYKFYLFLI